MDQQLKQRLIGVTIIVALVIIFVPMLFDKVGDRAAVTPDGIPPIPEDVVEKMAIALPKSAEDMAGKEKDAIPESGYKIFPLTDEAPPAANRNASAKAAGADPESMDVADEEEAMGEGEMPVPAEQGEPVEEDSPPAYVSKPEDKAMPAAAVQPETQAKKHNTPSAKPGMAAPSKPATPPLVKKPAAELPAAKAPPQDAAATARGAGKASAGSTGLPSTWVVQTGSFTSEAKATALMEKLRQAKYRAFVEHVQTANGTIHRVKVGPELERGRAEQIKQQIAANVGIKGIIVPHR